MDNIDGFMEIDDLQSERNLNQEEVDKIQGYLDKNPTIKKRFISEDNQYFLVTIQPYESGALNTFRDSIFSIANIFSKLPKIRFNLRPEILPIDT